jgi:AraC-like DNA-binding protein
VRSRRIQLLIGTFSFSIFMLSSLSSLEAAGQKLSAEQLLRNLQTENFSGEPIDLGLDDVDIETLIANLETHSGMNFELSPDVRLLSGHKRAYRFNGVPWDRILSFALKDAALEAVLDNGRILIQPKGGSMMKIVREDQQPSSKSRGGLFVYLACLLVLILGGGAVGFYVYRKRSGKGGSPRKPLIDPETADEVVKKIAYLFDVEKIYSNEGISIGSLSEELSIPPHQLSWVLNEKMDTTFSNLVNSYRVEEVKKRLTAQRETEKTILEIAYEAGFATKTSFNRVFKKYTQMTPSQYRKRYTP